MRTTTSVLVALVLACILALAGPVAAEEPGTGEDDGPCIKTEWDPPDVLVNPDCIWDYIPDNPITG